MVDEFCTVRRAVGREDHAIVVGIDRYAHFEDLRGAQNDARAVVDWLRDPDGGDVPNDQIHEIVSTDYPSEDRPLAEDVYAAFEELIDLAEDRAPKPAGRRLYVFMAGHGFAPDLRDAALLMANAKKRRYGHHVSGAKLGDHFARGLCFEEVVLFMDCCRVEIVGTEPASLPWEAVATGEGANPRWLYVFACCFPRLAREMTVDGEVRGVFTVALLEALRSGSSTSKTLEPLVVANMAQVMGADDLQTPHFQPSPDALQFGASLARPALDIVLGNAEEADVSIGRGLPGEPPLQRCRLRRGESWRVELDCGLYELVRKDVGDSGVEETSIVKLTMGDLDVTV